MKNLRQLIRQPGKTIAGVLLVAFAVAILCVCAGQALSARQTEEGTAENFTTIAYRGDYSWDWDNPTIAEGVKGYYSFSMDAYRENARFMDMLTEKYPEYVKLDFKPGFISAYVPELDELRSSEFPEAPNACAMLEVRLETIGQPQETFILGTTDMWESVEIPDGWEVVLTARVEKVIGLYEVWTDPVGYTIELTIPLPDESAAEDMEFEVGQRYLVYGMDYYDMYYDVLQYVNGDLSKNTGDDIRLTELDFDAIKYRTQQEIDKSSSVYDTYTVAYYHWGEYMVPINNHQIQLLQRCSMTLKNEADFGADGKYTIPTIAKLDTSAEEFLQSGDGALWRQALENLEITNDSFPVIGLGGSTKYLSAFVLDQCEIIDGRDFTEEELASGAKVCLVSNLLAQENGLSVGDTISPQFYENDSDSPYQNNTKITFRTTNPKANMYGAAGSFVGKAEEYTIVGIYEQDHPWMNTSNAVYYFYTYTFTPNTIFVPESSVNGEMEYFDCGVFRTLVLYNGCVPQVRKIVDEAGHQFLFNFADQGYTQIAEGLYDYQRVAKIALVTGAVLYGMVLLLYLLLFPGRQSRQMIVLNAMGTPVWKRVWGGVVSGFGILFPGTVLGCILARLSWDKLVGALLQAADVELEIVLTMKNLALIAASQLALALVLTAIITLALSAKYSGMKHK